jgi:hypothetical protein
MITTFDLGNDINATLTQDKQSDGQSSGQYVLNIRKSHKNSLSQTHDHYLQTVVSLRYNQWNRFKQVFDQIDQMMNSSQ